MVTKKPEMVSSGVQDNNDGCVEYLCTVFCEEIVNDNEEVETENSKKKKTYI